MTTTYVGQYLSINRMNLILVGLWPYQQSKFVQIQRILFSSILLSFITFQITTFLSTECTFTFVIKMLTSILLFSIYIITYISFWMQLKMTLQTFEHIQIIYNELKDKNEHAIIEKYARNIKLYTIILIVCGIIFIITIQPIWPKFFNVLLFGNNSQSYHGMNVITEYFVDPEKYAHFILLHNILAFCVGAGTVISIGTMLMAFCYYICSILAIVSYRIEQAVGVKSQYDCTIKKMNMMRKNIICAVHIHRKAMELTQFIVANIEETCMALIVIIIGSLSISLCRIFQLISYENDIAELMAQGAYSISLLIYMFLVSYISQEIMDHNNNIFITIYNTYWYTAPLHVQRLILFLLQRGTKPFILKVGKLIVGSLETFATMTSTSISYFTVMYSTQQ